jgi:hypothetical protein
MYSGSCLSGYRCILALRKIEYRAALQQPFNKKRGGGLLNSCLLSCLGPGLIKFCAATNPQTEC